MVDPKKLTMLDALELPDGVEKYMLKYLSTCSGKLLDVGGFPITDTIIEQADAHYKLQYHSLDIRNISETVGKFIHQDRIFNADITNCPQIADNSFDAIISFDTFEHLTEPWKAAKEITRILKPSGICVISTIFSWRFHPSPIDYWRFSPECLMYLFRELECLETNFDKTRRRYNYNGNPETNDVDRDFVSVDSFGAWKENWRVFFIGQKHE
jgi:SAM-dependent methyltransferase